MNPPNRNTHIQVLDESIKARPKVSPEKSNVKSQAKSVSITEMEKSSNQEWQYRTKTQNYRSHSVAKNEDIRSITGKTTLNHPYLTKTRIRQQQRHRRRGTQFPARRTTAVVVGVTSTATPGITPNLKENIAGVCISDQTYQISLISGQRQATEMRKKKKMAMRKRRSQRQQG